MAQGVQGIGTIENEDAKPVSLIDMDTPAHLRGTAPGEPAVMGSSPTVAVAVAGERLEL
jgi:hypothetical protein